MSKIVDFHSHILPGVDDGSKSVAESIAMLRMEAEQGIEHVIATPHFYAHHDTVEGFLKRREEAELQLREEMEKHNGLPRLSVGAEVHFFKGISHVDALQELTIDGKKCTLVEMPHIAWTDDMYRELEKIHSKQGITPIIAHVDRYLGRLRTFGIPERLETLPVLVQANASFFCNRATFVQAKRMLKKEQIHLLGSDCHSMGSRSPNLGAAIEKIRKRLGDSELERIVEFQASILDNGYIYEKMEEIK